jgi:type I restriction enzyme S subunit
MYGTIGRCCITTYPVATNQAIASFLGHPQVELEYLYYALESKADEFATASSQTTQANISARILKQTPIAIPPLPEQKKIAEILSGIDHSLAKLGDKINALTRLRVQLTRQFLTHEDHPQSNLEGILPLDWQVKTLDEVAQFRRGSFPQPYGNPEWFDENGFPFVQVFDIDDNGKLKSSTKSRISKAGAEKSVFIPCGSLIVSLQGSIGRVAITQYDAYVDRTILIFTDYQKDLDREYFSLLIGDLFSRQGEVADGGVIKTITKQTLKDFSIKIPPLNEQKRMSKVVFALDRHISLYKKKLLKGNFLKQSLMGDLLSGHKRVSI